ncbi:hypothetical protein PAMA_019451 [Pampus argenteus]
MMSSQSTVIDPVFRSKMPLFDGAIASTGLSKPKNMPGFLGKQALQYSGAYFTYDPRAKDGAGFTPDWNNSKNSLLDDRSPVNQLSGMEGENHIIYRQDGNSAEIGHSHTSPMSHTPIKQGFTPYTKNREISSPTAATVAVRKQKTAENSSPASENLVYLAIPKPVYGHNPCCNEVSCVIGQRYAVEHGSQRIQSTVYEHDWMQTDAHYSERPPIQRKVQDTLLQQRGVQFEHGAERLKRMTVETYSQSRARTLPAVIEPNYSSYPCTPTHTHFGSLNEQSQHLQTPSRGYPSLYSSHPTYEHMTSELYRERSHMSKYGQLTQHPMFYYPQANVEVEKRTQCKDIGGKQREDVPVILKHTMSSPRDHYAVPQSLRSEIPLHLPSTETMSNHSFIQGYDYPCYAVPRFNLNASQIRAPLKRQHASPSWHFNRINVSSSGQHGDHPVASVAKDKPDTSLHVDQSHTSSPFLLVDQTSPIRCVGQPGVSPPSIQMNRFFPSLTSQHIDRPILAPAGLNMDRLLDCSCEAQVMCPKQPKDHSVSPVSWLPQSPNHSSDRIPTAVTNGANVRKMIYSPAAATGNKHNGPTSSSATSVLKGSLKRSVSHSSPPMKIKEEHQDLYEVDLIKKRQKMEMENVQVRNQTNSPPMPVIDNVFSLAPYQPYLQASGVLFSGGVHPRTVQSSEHCEVKPKPFIKEKRPDRDQQPVVRAASKNICPDTPTERPAVDLFETQNIKVEKIDPPDTDNSVESSVDQKDCSKITIKEEPEDTDLNDDGLMLVIKKCESDELENKPSLTDGNETSDESKPVEVTTQITTPSQGDTSTPHDQVVSPHSKPIVTSPPPETKLNFKNIPRQCLKLSAYKIILPDMNSCAVPPQEKPPVEPTAEIIPKLELQMPVRKHFSELHHSLCKLVSKSVSASSEQTLRTWLSQLELTQPASPLTKVQKVSCLLGIKAREVWLNEEMKSALHKVLERLREYTAQERCPFPHVMRTGAVFVPMLVVKELLFSMVQGSFIDQVLQEHKVELRPTTLSEEKILIQLHKRACSSRLRKLMSLKHLPDIYADVLNLLYYTSVCKHLDSTSPDVQKRVQD